jgi:hypothetical protein
MSCQRVLAKVYMLKDVFSLVVGEQHPLPNRYSESFPSSARSNGNIQEGPDNKVAEQSAPGKNARPCSKK